MKLVFATNNGHKLKEIRAILNHQFVIVSLNDIGCTDDLPETSATLSGNAIQKARYVFDKYGLNCFADDSGLEIDALHGRPGVYSARFAGEHKSDDDNINKVLIEMKGIEKRNATFKTVIALITSNHQNCFEGTIAGSIASAPHGNNGFGYDPIFIPEGSEHSFAEMNEEEKNKISHRGRALNKLVMYLKENMPSPVSNKI